MLEFVVDFSYQVSLYAGIMSQNNCTVRYLGLILDLIIDCSFDVVKSRVSFMNLLQIGYQFEI